MSDMTQPPKRPAHRPRLPESEKLKVVPLRLNERQRETRKRIGDQAIRDWLDKQAT